MSTTGKQAKQARRQAEIASQQTQALRIEAEQRLAREREKTQQLFIRQLRARTGGGFFNPAREQGLSSTLG